MHNIYAVMYREFKIRTTSMTWILFDLAVPLFYLLLFGIGLNTAFRDGVAVGGSTVDYNSFFISSVIAMTGFGLGINTSYGFFTDRDNGIFYEFLSYPMTRGEFLFGKILFSSCISSVQAVLSILLAVFVLHVPILTGYLPVLIAVNIAGTAGWVFSLTTIALRIRRNDYYNTIINVLYFALMFASSMFFPLDGSPGWLHAVALLNPLTWHTDVLRFVTIGTGDATTIAIEAGAYLMFTSAAYFLAVRTLNRVT